MQLIYARNLCRNFVTNKDFITYTWQKIFKYKQWKYFIVRINQKILLSIFGYRQSD